MVIDNNKNNPNSEFEKESQELGDPLKNLGKAIIASLKKDLKSALLFFGGALIGALLILALSPASSKAARTQPFDRTTQRPAPASLVPVAPEGCIDDCIRWEDYNLEPKTKRVCKTITKRGKRKVYRSKSGKVVISTINRKKVCKEVLV